jgi:hypothetical protein
MKLRGTKLLAMVPKKLKQGSFKKKSWKLVNGVDAENFV